MANPLDLSAFDIVVREIRSLSERDRGHLLALFETTYRQANAAYLEKSLRTLRHVALALRGGLAVGFALGDTRVMDIPRLPAQAVSLAGLACVAPEFRRGGLFLELGRLAITAGAQPGGARRLVCGRMAHPAAMRTIARFPSVVPRAGSLPTAWQQEVGSAIAAAYGAHRFDPATFVCIGDGTPIGHPRIDIEVSPSEWDVFQPVDRGRGDSLLAVAWVPDAPPGW